MLTNFKFTGVNIASALLIFAFFMPWINVTLMSMSGYSLAATAVSPGMLGMFFDGSTRLLLIFIALVPLSGAFIIWQNVSEEKKYLKYMKLAHMLPSFVLLIVISILVIKTRSIAQPQYPQMGNLGFNFQLPEIKPPSVFDILGSGVYLSVAFGIYLFMVIKGKVKDKIYFNQSVVSTEQTQKTN